MFKRFHQRFWQSILGAQMLVWGRLTEWVAGPSCGHQHQRGHSALCISSPVVTANAQSTSPTSILQHWEKEQYWGNVSTCNCLILYVFVSFRMLCFDSEIIKVRINRKLYLQCVPVSWLLSPATPHSASPLGEKNPICGNFMEILFPRRTALSSPGGAATLSQRQRCLWRQGHAILHSLAWYSYLVDDCGLHLEATESPIMLDIS